MDFVFSKVGMSVCALVISAVLASTLDGAREMDLREELEGFARWLADGIASASAPGIEARRTLTIPWLSDGSEVDARIACDSLLLRVGRSFVCEQLADTVHLWRWNGSDLCEGDMASLDSSCEPIEAESGDALSVVSTYVSVDHAPWLLSFVEVVDEGDQKFSTMSAMAPQNTSASSAVLYRYEDARTHPSTPIVPK